MNLSQADLKTYSAEQVASLAGDDYHSVRDEGFRRQEAALKKIARAKKMLAAAERELAASFAIITAAERARN